MLLQNCRQDSRFTPDSPLRTTLHPDKGLFRTLGDLPSGGGWVGRVAGGGGGGEGGKGAVRFGLIFTRSDFDAILGHLNYLCSI